MYLQYRGWFVENSMYTDLFIYERGAWISVTLLILQTLQLTVLQGSSRGSSTLHTQLQATFHLPLPLPNNFLLQFLCIIRKDTTFDMMCLWRSKDNIMESSFNFIQAAELELSLQGLPSKRLYPLSHPPPSGLCFLPSFLPFFSTPISILKNSGAFSSGDCGRERGEGLDGSLGVSFFSETYKWSPCVVY